eukprot:CAMPEP_0172507524 /NCGR_PEP_ID=MMETSP1066-20121228/204252_1 /TAXON_ID=671091 /ORGANISM="Coscinodiscus wailesii, Strain CCMP2513" /LENGTH=295 /DNA_ID=CAMNT_0013285091 /DNA_START=65 /DNA_END=949 /DNA_ORIENTATION=-
MRLSSFLPRLSLTLTYLTSPSESFQLTQHSRLILHASQSNNHLDDGATKGLKVGFLGCGVIATSIAKGLLTQSSDTDNGIPITSIAITKRSEQKSKSLRDSHPDKVTIYDDPQHVVDNSDLVFLCVLPQQVESLLSRISFDETRHTLVSLVSTATVTDLTSCSKLPPGRVHRMICLPSVSRRQGVCLLTPPALSSSSLSSSHAGISLRPLLENLGGVVECETERQMVTMTSATGLMGPLYAILRSNRDYLTERGVPRSKASSFIAKFYGSVISDAMVDCEEEGRFDDLIREQTPG